MLLGSRYRRLVPNDVEPDVNPATGAFSGGTDVLLAVSTTSNPTGTWNIYQIETTNDGDLGNCPCLGDLPLIGADANGFYISTNDFPLFSAGFNGAMVYALSKTTLAAGGTPTVVKFFQPTLAEGFAYSIQPTTTPRRRAICDRERRHRILPVGARFLWEH